MKHKEIVKYLKEGKNILRQKIGYQTDYISLEGERLTQRQLYSLIDKDLIKECHRDLKTLNGIGGKMMDVFNIKYNLKE